jgi:hypothetical protein
LKIVAIQWLDFGSLSSFDYLLLYGTVIQFGLTLFVILRTRRIVAFADPGETVHIEIFRDMSIFWMWLVAGLLWFAISFINGHRVGLLFTGSMVLFSLVVIILNRRKTRTSPI